MSNFPKLAALGLLSISATAQANTINTPSHHFSISNNKLAYEYWWDELQHGCGGC